MLRITIAAAYRSGSEVLLADFSPLASIADAEHVCNEIAGHLGTHADLIFEGGAELVVRLTSRRFEPMVDDGAKCRPKRFTPRRPGEL
jgi:hypothetical protein